MANSASDLELRKQLLLTRIALERVQWTHDVQILRTAANPRNIVSSAVRSAIPEGWAQAILGAGRNSGARAAGPSLGSRLLKAVVFARRYPVLVSLAGSLLARRAVRRVFVIGTFGVALALGLSIAKKSSRRHPPGT